MTPNFSPAWALVLQLILLQSLWISLNYLNLSQSTLDSRDCWAWKSQISSYTEIQTKLNITWSCLHLNCFLFYFILDCNIPEETERESHSLPQTQICGDGKKTKGHQWTVPQVQAVTFQFNMKTQNALFSNNWNNTELYTLLYTLI